MFNPRINHRWHRSGTPWLLGLLVLAAFQHAAVAGESPLTPPLFRTIDLNRGES
jgi:hypothetical protein